MNKMHLCLALLSATLLLASCQKPESDVKVADKPAVKAAQVQSSKALADSSVTASKVGDASAVGSENTILFFMNPNGRPCKIQDQIIQQGMADISKKAKVTYVKTTVAADRSTFYEYGIRSLPNLVVVDSTGTEVHRFAPGIQDMNKLMAVLGQM